MYIDHNLNSYNWFQRNAKDSHKYTEKLSKLGAKIQSLSDKINSLKDVKIEISEKLLENNDKTFTLKVVGNLNLNNKSFIKDIAEQFASILDNYKSKKIEELSKELDSTIEEMKNVFPQEITIYNNSSTGVKINPYDYGKTWIGGGDSSQLYSSSDSSQNLLCENNTLKTVIDWKNDLNSKG